MKTIRFKDSNVIDINDVVENREKIYCVNYHGKLRFLLKKESGKYCWTSLSLKDDMPSNTYSGEAYYTNFREALKTGYEGYEIMIFDSQCEVLKYAKSM